MSSFAEGSVDSLSDGLRSLLRSVAMSMEASYISFPSHTQISVVLVSRWADLLERTLCAVEESAAVGITPNLPEGTGRNRKEQEESGANLAFWVPERDTISVM